MTKKTLREEIDALVSEYLGFKTSSGLPKSASHATLERRLLVYRRMIEHIRAYREVRNKYTNEQLLAFGLSWNYPKDLEAANLRQRSASFAWLNPDVAAEALRVNGDF